MEAEAITGIILAGGRSARMGSNKALLPVDGKPLLRHLAERMLALGVRRIIVACGTEERGREYRTLLQGLHGTVGLTADRFPDCGPLAGLHAALSAMPEPGYGFAMACDMPVISETLFARMGRAAEESASRPQLVRTALQPFHALYHTSAAEELERRLERGDLRVMPLLNALLTVELEPAAGEEEAFINLNTPELYERYVHLRGNRD
ncbi:molybdenum cofactor guanylyltransferase [Paenibacillus sacheonensis]|uniref:Probable molybdenum cofactor guanylyltransferase n=1 Tax=Paenibacillus sacheonensis TaxID=742054 RepID=A0A7X4YWY9_9BACL|nr:molybdenum cofactor guanylyltransferase [Paenibacillus sacheonensis]MBM7566587.1 molybdopterin-guanine dinucleotide biosynthesis protein A [Paenibacillus sacheonensis]NBC73086.1 NTP transferase domain-containing protein [Paenibacillus sacheonensis]